MANYYWRRYELLGPFFALRDLHTMNEEIIKEDNAYGWMGYNTPENLDSYLNF